MTDEPPIYCSYCTRLCPEEEDAYMYGDGDEPYCSEECAEDDGAYDAQDGGAPE